jgi:type I restriction enzyme S subunit
MNVNQEIEKRGVLPSGWQWAKLGDTCLIIAGQSPPSETYRQKPEGLPFFQGKADFGMHHPVPRVWCSVPNKVAKSGDILISVRAPVGPTNVADEDCCIGRGIAAIRCGNEIEMEFLLSWLRYKENDLEKMGSGSTFGAIARKDLENFGVPIPPLTEQKRFVAILNKHMAAIEKARAAAEAQLVAAKALPEAYLRQEFPKEGEALPPGWRWIKLGAHAKKIGSGLTPLGGHSSYLNAGIPLVRSQNVQNNRFAKEGLAFISSEQDEEMANSRVIEHDVLLNITGASIGRVCVVPSEICPANVNQHVSIIRCDSGVFPAFLSFYISMADFQKHIFETQAGATRQALTKALIEEFEIPLPSLAEQIRIATQLNEKLDFAERLKADLETQLAEINALPAALLRRAFNGEL